MEQDYYDAFSEVYVIIQQMEKENVNKISKNFIKFIEQNRNKDYQIDSSVKLLDNVAALKKETRIILGIIYKDYFCKDKQDEEVNKIEKIEEFCYENLFKKSAEKDESNVDKNNENSKVKILDISKENILMKFFRKIRNSIINFINRKKG